MAAWLRGPGFFCFFWAIFADASVPAAFFLARWCLVLGSLSCLSFCWAELLLLGGTCSVRCTYVVTLTEPVLRSLAREHNPRLSRLSLQDNCFGHVLLLPLSAFARMT